MLIIGTHLYFVLDQLQCVPTPSVIFVISLSIIIFKISTPCCPTHKSNQTLVPVTVTEKEEIKPQYDQLSFDRVFFFHIHINARTVNLVSLTFLKGVKAALKFSSDSCITRKLFSTPLSSEDERLPAF